MNLTYDQLRNYQNSSVLWLRKNPDNQDTKAGKAIKKIEKAVLKSLKPLSDLNEELEITINDINSDNALTDSVTKKFIYDILKDSSGNEITQYAYTPESRKKRDKEIRAARKKYESDLELLLEKESDFNEPYYITEIPPNFTAEEKRVFIGILIKPESEENK